MTAIYNEIASYPAAWLRNLIAAGHIADGVVDERSIVELKATELVGCVQFHAFAGIGIWSAGLRLAGWPDSRPVWTASLPCQPWSQAGAGQGFDDERHLWPVYFELVRECRPDLILGEQVSSPDGRAWFDAVSADLEGAGYAVGALNTCAAGVGAPHIRQRLYWCAVANPDRSGLARWPVDGGDAIGRGEATQRGGGDGVRGLGHADGEHAGRDSGGPSRAEAAGPSARFVDGAIGDEPRASGAASQRRDPWAEVEWLPCADGKHRPAQPGTRPLAARTPGGVEQVCAYGNGLCLEQCATFIEAVMDVVDRRAA